MLSNWGCNSTENINFKLVKLKLLILKSMFISQNWNFILIHHSKYYFKVLHLFLENSNFWHIKISQWKAKLLIKNKLFKFWYGIYKGIAIKIV